MNQANDFMQDSCELARELEPSSKTDWLADFREQQLQAFSATPFPTRKTEAFKYNNLAILNQHQFSSLAEFDEPESELPELCKSLSGDRLVIVNGHFAPQLSKLSTCTLTKFSEASDEQKTFILEQLNQQSKRQHVFATLRDSLAHDGVLVEFGNNDESNSVHVVYLTTAAVTQATLPVQTIFHLNKHVKASVVEHFVNESKAENTNIVNQSSLFVLEENAQLDHYRLNLENELAIHFGQSNFKLDKYAQLNSFNVGLGSELKRVDINVWHQGSGSSAKVDGVYLSQHKQQIDYHTNVEHCVPHCTSSETFRGIISGESKAVFNGRIHIHPDAQKTEAMLSNKNLLLSNRAEINTKPELEIYADDVRCAHGATISQLDKDALFYLISRGIEKSEAELMLGFAFINALLDDLSIGDIADFLRPIFSRFFKEAKDNV